MVHKRIHWILSPSYCTAVEILLFPLGYGANRISPKQSDTARRVRNFYSSHRQFFISAKSCWSAEWPFLSVPPWKHFWCNQHRQFDRTSLFTFCPIFATILHARSPQQTKLPYCVRMPVRWRLANKRIGSLSSFNCGSLGNTITLCLSRVHI